MIDFLYAIRRGLQRDALVRDLVGFDSDSEVKVYSTVGKTNVKPKFVVVQQVPGDVPISVYGDEYVIERVSTQITSWGNNHREVQQLAEAVDDAVHLINYETTPYQLMIVKRTISPGEMPDRDTNWRQIPVTYDFAFSLEGRT